MEPGLADVIGELVVVPLVKNHIPDRKTRVMGQNNLLNLFHGQMGV
jgi:hypothetical protein